jgi:hypothetical protein
MRCTGRDIPLNHFGLHRRIQIGGWNRVAALMVDAVSIVDRDKKMRPALLPAVKVREAR